jgi:hypothetical protein
LSESRKFDWRKSAAWCARWIVQLWPRATKEWGQAFAAELPEIAGFSASVRWLIGGAMLLTREHARSVWRSAARLIDVGGHVARNDAWRLAGTHGAITFRLPVIVSVSAHALMIGLVLLASWGYVTQMPLRVAIAPPLPPPVPEAPPEVTDARVFPNAPTLYSSLPLQMSDEGDALRIYVANGVGINFLSLPDIGATYRQGNAAWRVWPGQALESFLVRRVLPEYPRTSNSPGAASVFVEYLILQDGSVKVLRTSGPTPYIRAAQSAIEQWVYRPLEYENRPCEVICRVEVRFDSEFAQSGMLR